MLSKKKAIPPRRLRWQHIWIVTQTTNNSYIVEGW
nr:MAG TPA: hypothetical protein [Caudoviricetes sp.]